MTPLTILALGAVRPDHIAPLIGRFEPVEQIDVPIPARDDLPLHRAAINRAIDAAAADWILILREREIVSEPLADEIARYAADNAKAWGYRIRVVPLYAGRPLRLGDDGRGGEMRLFHRRHYIRFANKGQWDEISVQGTIVRAREPLHAVTFDSPEAHRRWLEGTAVPHSVPRRALLFLRNAIASGALDASTLRYLWIEAGFDHGTAKR